jgi:tetratricopeptide (TPR) repeat protein
MLLNGLRCPPNTQGARLFALLAVGAIVSACGGSTPPPKEADDLALLQDQDQDQNESDDKVLAASNEEVKRGMDALKAGNFQEAEAIFKKARADSPEDPQAAHYHGVALEGLEQFDAAVEAYKKAIELQPKLIAASQNLSALLQTLEKYEESLAVADAGLEIDPKDPGLLINRAYAVDLMGDPKTGNPKAIAAYESALAEAPDNLNLQYYYANALATNGDKAKSLAQLGKLPLDGKEVPIVEIVAVYNKLGAFAECDQALSTQIDKGKTVELLIYRSTCRSGKNDSKGAEADLRDAVATDDSSASAHLYLARYLNKAGKKAEAKKHLDRANELKPAQGGE